MKRALILAAAALGISGCSSAHPPATIPSLSGSSTTHAHSGYSPTRVSQLHAAAQCIRSHGVPSYQDPVLAANGQVYTDARSFQDLSQDATGGNLVTIPQSAPLAGLGAAIAVGVLAGVYPAARAARLSPADAPRAP